MIFVFQKDFLDSVDGQIIYRTITDSLNYKIGLHSVIIVPSIKTVINRTDICPIGDISFVEDWLKANFNKTMKPIEIPEILRKEAFLKREYSIMQMHDVLELPREKKAFIKNCTKLKAGSFSGTLSIALRDYFITCSKTDWFVVSELINIQSEWRVYVIDDKIENIANYDGLPTIFPNSEKIKTMVDLYNSTDHPSSYTMDVAIADGNTVIIEVHPFCCVGLYNSLWGDNLAEAYTDGINWYKSQI